MVICHLLFIGKGRIPWGFLRKDILHLSVSDVADVSIPSFARAFLFYIKRIYILYWQY